MWVNRATDSPTTVYTGEVLITADDLTTTTIAGDLSCSTTTLDDALKTYSGQTSEKLMHYKTGTNKTADLIDKITINFLPATW